MINYQHVDLKVKIAYFIVFEDLAHLLLEEDSYISHEFVTQFLTLNLNLVYPHVVYGSDFHVGYDHLLSNT